MSPIRKHIIYDSFHTGNFPSSLKIAKVTPIHKSGDKNQLSNFRPISILPLLSKIIEKLVFKQVLNFLEKYNLLHNNQYGFRPNRSTTQAILDNLHFIYDSLDSNHTVISLFLDFSKAFDCIDHKILLSKLHFYGFRGIANAWFESYLSGRYQLVSINNINSDLKLVTHGVPQGSILGPLLFLLFINDFPDSNTFFKFTLFADDSSLLCKFSHNDSFSIHQIITNQLEPVSNWLISNKIKVNSEKCKFITFRYKNKPIDIPPIPFGNGSISQDSNIKFLGLILNQNLTFSQHIYSIQTKLSKSVGLLFKLNKFLPASTLKLMYDSLIKPYLTYAIEAWYSAPKYLTDKVLILQKKSIRAINSLPYNEHTSKYFKEMKILKLPDLYRENLVTYFFNTVNKNANLNISQFIEHNQNIHQYPTRNRTNIHLPLFRKTHTQAGFLYRGIKAWNELSGDLRSAGTSVELRRKLRETCWQSY